MEIALILIVMLVILSSIKVTTRKTPKPAWVDIVRAHRAIHGDPVRMTGNLDKPTIIPTHLSAGTRFRFRSWPKRWTKDPPTRCGLTFEVVDHIGLDKGVEGQPFGTKKGCRWGPEFGVLPDDDIEIVTHVKESADILDKLVSGRLVGIPLHLQPTLKVELNKLREAAADKDYSVAQESDEVNEEECEYWHSDGSVSREECGCKECEEMLAKSNDCVKPENRFVAFLKRVW